MSTFLIMRLIVPPVQQFCAVLRSSRAVLNVAKLAPQVCQLSEGVWWSLLEFVLVPAVSTEPRGAGAAHLDAVRA
eukprot:2582392-Prymnesium_polylepis.1